MGVADADLTGTFCIIGNHNGRDTDLISRHGVVILTQSDFLPLVYPMAFWSPFVKLCLVTGIATYISVCIPGEAVHMP